MFYPKLRPLRSRRVSTDRFLGYEHRLHIPDGAFFETENLSGDAYPLLSSRKPRGLIASLDDPGGLLEKDAPCWVAGGTLYVNGLATAVTGLGPGEKQLVSIGAYVLIFPDKVYYNTADPADWGSMEASFETLGSVTYTPCSVDGEAYTVSSTGPQEPSAPENGEIWIDTADGGTVYRQWSQASLLWVEIETVYIRIGFTCRGEIPRLFRQYDGVRFSGSQKDELNGEKILYAVGGDENTDDYVVVAGLLREAYTDEGKQLKLERKLPQMDYVCECQNRLWGCFYGSDGEKNLNEIYCSALGDFRNFRQYLGLSTDSWTASVGSDGPWTGAVNYLGSPTFFKENRIHRVSVSSSGAHRLEETVCRGVQRGSHKSLCVVGETLLYKSRTDVCAWQGGFPHSISGALGEDNYSEAAAGSIGEKYYISMRNADGVWSLFVYDLGKALWYREDGLRALCFARCGDSLCCIDAQTGKLWDLQGAEGEAEACFPWLAETGVQSYETADRKYLTRFDIKLQLAEGGWMKAYLNYDSGEEWLPAGEIEGRGLETVLLPVRPRRCDHLRLRLAGEGELRIFSITRKLRKGSDLP